VRACKPIHQAQPTFGRKPAAEQALWRVALVGHVSVYTPLVRSSPEIQGGVSASEAISGRALSRGHALIEAHSKRSRHQGRTGDLLLSLGAALAGAALCFFLFGQFLVKFSSPGGRCSTSSGRVGRSYREFGCIQIPNPLRPRRRFAILHALLGAIPRTFRRGQEKTSDSRPIRASAHRAGSCRRSALI